ncbi:hypothetical protein [Siminovitchia sp. 179-K 8D1 HS]|uniref:hypothetical protein n=1 Tax=Siminovitchia sp. 179-K 8D1 HS TaxID=3142385 RepID=UPI0039A1FE2B
MSAMKRMIEKFCKVNKAKFVGYSGTYNFVDENGMTYFLSQRDLVDFMKRQ